MSRATISEADARSSAAREALRRQHGVRLVAGAEEGHSVMNLPDGVYGFTFAPAIAAPLFSGFRYRAFEIHRTAGQALVVGFLTEADAERFRAATEPFEMVLSHDRTDEATVIVAVPYSRIVRHRQYSAHNTTGLHLTAGPAV